MFVGTLTGAEEVTRVSEDAGHPESMTPEVIAQWITTDTCPACSRRWMLDAEVATKYIATYAISTDEAWRPIFL